MLHLAYGKNGERLHGKFVTMFGERQICISRQPLLDAARVLKAEGVDPETRSSPAMPPPNGTPARPTP